MTRKQAIALAESNWWKDVNAHDIVMFQLFEEKLCMDFGDFHGAVEQCLKRPVWTHEFAIPDNLRKEFLGEKPAPTMQQIIDLIPKEKRILIL